MIKISFIILTSIFKQLTHIYASIGRKYKLNILAQRSTHTYDIVEDSTIIVLFNDTKATTK